MPLTQEQVQHLLTKSTTDKGYPPPKQFGPLRWFDKEMRCASRGCSSPTVLQLEGTPRCSVHALRIMNEMLTNPEEILAASDEDKEQAKRNGRLGVYAKATV